VKIVGPGPRVGPKNLKFTSPNILNFDKKRASRSVKFAKKEENR
jgi:hypothetical protein